MYNLQNFTSFLFIYIFIIIMDIYVYLLIIIKKQDKINNYYIIIIYNN